MKQQAAAAAVIGPPPGAAPDELPTVSLTVCVADAQGLKLMRGGEIRLVLTLRTASDPQGERFGAKVTPWQTVPESEAPRWRAREALFTVPAQWGNQAGFIESVYLHISLMQRGHQQPGADMAVSQAGQGSLGYFALGAALGVVGALHETTSALLGGSTDRGESIGVLKLPIGKHLVRGNACTEGASWAHLHEEHLDGAGRLRGSLLLDFATAHNSPQSRAVAQTTSVPQTPALQSQPAVPHASQQQAHELPQPPHNSPQPEAVVQTTDAPKEPAVKDGPSQQAHDLQQPESLGEEHGDTCPILPEMKVAKVADDGQEALDAPTDFKQDLHGVTEMSPRNADAFSDSSTSAEDVMSNVSANRESTTSSATSTSATRTDIPAQCDGLAQSGNKEGDRPVLRPVPAAQWAAAIERPAPRGSQGDSAFASQWSIPEQGNAVRDAFDISGSFNIFTINNPSASSVDTSAGSGGGAPKAGFETSELKDLFSSLSSRKPTTSIKKKMLFMVNSEVRQQRQEVRKWRRRHEIFCVLNEIEQRFAEVLNLLRQASASMRRFGESHTMLCDVLRLSAFLRDAGLYYRSEAQVPTQVENHLGELERTADEFRSISLDDVADGEATTHELAEEDAARTAQEHRELLRESEDLQVDVAVLLESSLMTAQQALAEYKRMHCRLELLATEYAPSIRFELEATRPIFLPLIMDSESTQVAAAAVPDQAVQWALDFSELVGVSSQGLDGLVKALGNRQTQLRSCAAELREHILRRAARLR